MPEHVWYIGFTVSMVFTAASSILIGRRIYKTGVEYFSSRILIISSILNSSLCGLLFVLQGTSQLNHISTSDSSHFSQYIVPAVFFLIPGRILWNYFTTQNKLFARFHLKPHAAGDLSVTIDRLCKAMRIDSPKIASSHRVMSPFVFGRRSAKAILAVPEKWQDVKNNHSYIQLLHELAHIRNHDVGFLAWTNAGLRDLRFLFLLLPVLICYCYFSNYHDAIPSITLYLICSVALFVMLRYVVRKRETLADMTAALLIQSGNVSDVISEHQIDILNSQTPSGPITELKLTEKMQQWLTDKALFSKKQQLWKTFLWVFDFFHASHPSNAERVKTLNKQNAIVQESFSSRTESFWAGVTLGLLSIVIGLGSYWYAVFIQKPPAEPGVLRLPFEIYGMISMIPVGFLAIFLALPVWSSLKLPALDGRFFGGMFIRYATALAGACLVCPFILIAGTANQDIWGLLLICFLWNVSVTIFAFGINAIIISLWVTVRYLQSSHAAELRKGLLGFGLFIIVFFSLVVIGGILINDEMIFQGIDIVFSTIVGGAFVSLAVRGSRFSETERYIILCAPFCIFRIEGKRFRTFVLIHAVYITALLLLFVSLLYFTIYIFFGRILDDLDSTVGIIIAGSACCAVIVLLERSGLNRISERKRSKIYELYDCLKSLSATIDSCTHKKLVTVAAGYDLPAKNMNHRNLNLTMHDAYEAAFLLFDDPVQRHLLDRISLWVLRCQRQGGFGIWPSGAPRLSSTYKAVSILQKVNLLDQCDVDLHISWLKSLQRSDGTFKDPTSEIESCRDTFYAIRSLNMLGFSLAPDKAHICRKWCGHILIEKGIHENRPDIIYHCLGALTALGEVGENILTSLREWFSSAVDELLLSNISLSYENVYYTVMIYPLLKSVDNLCSEPLNLLKERINTALEAELVNVSA